MMYDYRLDIVYSLFIITSKSDVSMCLRCCVAGAKQSLVNQLSSIALSYLPGPFPVLFLNEKSKQNNSGNRAQPIASYTI